MADIARTVAVVVMSGGSGGGGGGGDGKGPPSWLAQVFSGGGEVPTLPE